MPISNKVCVSLFTEPLIQINEGLCPSEWLNDMLHKEEGNSPHARQRKVFSFRVSSS